MIVCFGISLRFRTELHILYTGQETLTEERYVDDILQEHVVPFAPLTNNTFLLLHDNARPHSPKIVHQYFEELEIYVLPVPAKSTDLNPIEYV